MDGEAGAKSLNASRMNMSAVDFDAEIEQAWAQVTGSAAGAVPWIALGYESKKKLKLLATGMDGGYGALRPHLTDDAVVYGAFKLAEPAKLIFVTSIGENTGGMVKGRATAHAQSVENALEGTTVGLQLAEEDEKEPEAVVAKLAKAIGAAVTL